MIATSVLENTQILRSEKIERRIATSVPENLRILCSKKIGRRIARSVLSKVFAAVLQ